MAEEDEFARAASSEAAWCRQLWQTVTPLNTAATAILATIILRRKKSKILTKGGCILGKVRELKKTKPKNRRYFSSDVTLMKAVQGDEFPRGVPPSCPFCTQRRWNRSFCPRRSLNELEHYLVPPHASSPGCASVSLLAEQVMSVISKTESDKETVLKQYLWREAGKHLRATPNGTCTQAEYQAAVTVL